MCHCTKLPLEQPDLLTCCRTIGTYLLFDSVVLIQDALVTGSPLLFLDAITKKEYRLDKIVLELVSGGWIGCAPDS